MMPLVHFLEEQGRHRRSSAISAALVVVALAVSGIPLSVLISPLVVAGVAVLVGVADIGVEIPAGLDAWLNRAFHLLPNTWSAIRRSDVDIPWDLLAGMFVLPGLVTMVLLWALVRFTFRRTGIGGVLRRMKTRPPRSGDLAEQRLANLVQEVAVAAAVPPPRVLLIASVGNGDLTVAAEIMTLIQTWGLVSLVLEAAFLPASRASLRLVGRTAMETLRGQADASNRELAVDTLLAGAGWGQPGLRRAREAAGRSPAGAPVRLSAPPDHGRSRRRCRQGHHLAHGAAHGTLRRRVVAGATAASGRDCCPAHAPSGGARRSDPDPRGYRYDMPGVICRRGRLARRGGLVPRRSAGAECTGLGSSAVRAGIAAASGAGRAAALDRATVALTSERC